MNWRDRISAAQVRGAFTTQDLKDARGLGIEFYLAVRANEFNRAREIVLDIEKRLP